MAEPREQQFKLEYKGFQDAEARFADIVFLQRTGEMVTLAFFQTALPLETAQVVPTEELPTATAQCLSRITVPLQVAHRLREILGDLVPLQDPQTGEVR